MGVGTRAMMAGLLGLGLAMASPMTAEARGDARQTVQPQRSTAPAARPANAARPNAALPTGSRPQAAAPRRDAAPARAASTRNAAARPTQQASRQQASLPNRRTAAESRNQTARQRATAAVPYANGRQAGTNAGNLRQSAMMTCTTRNGRRTCTPQARNASFRWTGGLAPAAMSQSSCPEGTMATTAIGHSNVVRCVPL